MQVYGPPSLKIKKKRVVGPGPTLVYPCGFFDGDSAKYVGGVGYCIFLNESHSFEYALGVGNNTNTKAEFVGLWAIMLSSQMMGIPTLNVYGDSSVIINWAKGSVALTPPELSHWCRETRKLSSCFQKLSFNHIYREHN